MTRTIASSDATTRARLRGFGHDLQLARRTDLHHVDAPRDFADLSSARSYLRAVESDPFARATLREALATAPIDAFGSTATDRDLAERLAPRLATGELCAIELPDAPGAPTHDVEIPRLADLVDEGPAPAAPDEDVHWITFQLFEQDTDMPASGARLKVTLPDGRVRIYPADADGMVHISDLPPGTCDLEQIIDDEVVEIVQFA